METSRTRREEQAPEDSHSPAPGHLSGAGRNQSQAAWKLLAPGDGHCCGEGVYERERSERGRMVLGLGKEADMKR